jgi:hypothetical protein
MRRTSNGDFLSARNGYEQLRRSLSVGVCMGFGLATIIYPFLVFPSPTILAIPSIQFILIGLGITVGAALISRRVSSIPGTMTVVGLVAAVSAALFCLVTALSCP